jgi:cytochrome P450
VGRTGYWSITKYDDIQEISKLPKIFSSDQAHGGITLPDPEMFANRERAMGRTPIGPKNSLLSMAVRSMITMDPPDHNQHRRMVAPGFTPQTLDNLLPRIRERARVILDSIGNGNQCEFVSSVAAELPIQMLAELFNVPQNDRHKLFHWSNLIIGGDDPDISLPRDQVIGAFMEIAATRCSCGRIAPPTPGNDLISMLVNTRVDGQPMGMADYLQAFILLVVAGNETTRNSISGAILALIAISRGAAKAARRPGPDSAFSGRRSSVGCTR